jgi:histidinol dehydrogenase
MGGAQAIFALAYGTDTIDPVDVVAGPGNAWVQAAKDNVSGAVGIDALAGPSELMVIIERVEDAEYAALDLCAQAEHGPDSPLLVVSTNAAVLSAVSAATANAAAERPGVANAQMALVQVPNTAGALDLANEFAPEHLELLGERAASRANRVTTAGCIFSGRLGATSFGDYIAGSNHVLPTAGTGQYFGPLGPGTFRRKITTVEMSPDAVNILAPHVDTLARAEGFPVHGESAMIRTRDT